MHSLTLQLVRGWINECVGTAILKYAALSLYIVIIFASGIRAIYYLSYLIIFLNMISIVYAFKKRRDIKLGFTLTLIIILALWYLVTAFWSANPLYTSVRSLLFFINA